MSNYSAVISKKFTFDSCLKVLHDINSQYFNGKVASMDDEKASVFTLTYGDTIIYFWIAKHNITGKNKLSWRTEINDYRFWLTEFIASKMVRNLSPQSKIKNEGISERYAPDYDIQYPTYEQWIKHYRKRLTKNQI